PHPLKGLGTAIPLENLNLPAFLGNLFFLQTIFCATFGSNGPLWSLANEFWYYVLFPVALGAALAWSRFRLRADVPLTCLAVVVCLLLGIGKLLGFLIWLAGVALVLLHAKVRLRSTRVSLAVLLLCSLALGLTLFASRSLWGATVENDLAVGFAFALFLFAALQFAAGESSPRYSAIAHHLAGFSYSLYVLHFPFLLFLRNLLVPVDH